MTRLGQSTPSAQRPAAHIHLVCTVVERFAGAPVPEPMPVVMDQVAAVGAARGRALPELVVQPAGDRFGLTASDGESLIGVPSAGKVGLADETSVDFLDRLLHVGERPALVAH